MWKALKQWLRDFVEEGERLEESRGYGAAATKLVKGHSHRYIRALYLSSLDYGSFERGVDNALEDWGYIEKDFGEKLVARISANRAAAQGPSNSGTDQPAP